MGAKYPLQLLCIEALFTRFTLYHISELTPARIGIYTWVYCFPIYGEYFPQLLFFQTSLGIKKRARELLLSSWFYLGYCFVFIFFPLYSLFHFPYPLTLASPRRFSQGLWGLGWVSRVLVFFYRLIT